MDRIGWRHIILLVCLWVCSFSTLFGQTFDERKRQVDSLFLKSDEELQRGDETSADELVGKAMDIARQINGGDHITYISLEYVQAERLRNRNRNAEALSMLEDAYARWRKTNMFHSEFSIQMLQSLTETAIKQKCYSEAQTWSSQYMDATKSFYGMMSSQYVNALYLSAEANLNLRQFAVARQRFLEYLAFRIKTETYDESRFEDCYSYMSLGYCEHELGNYQEAEEYYAMADSLFWANGKWDNLHVGLLNMRGTNFISLGQYENADSCYKWSGELQADNTGYMDLLAKANQAALIMEDDPQKSLNAYAEILETLSERGDSTSVFYGNALVNAGMCCFNLDNDELAAQCLEEGIPLLDAEGNPLSENLLQALAVRVAVYESLGNVGKVESCSKEVSEFASHAIVSAFPQLTEKERAPLWNRFSDWFTRLLPTYALDHQTAGLRRACYDGVLQSRGLLLNSSLNVERILRNATDPMLKDLYQQWMHARQVQMSAQTQELLEKRILMQLPSQGNFMGDMKINTDSLLQYMQPGDVAIEFLAVEQSETEDSLYVALVLTPHDPAPLMVPLMRSGELEKMKANALVSDELYRNLWDRIPRSAMSDARRIFFAVDGELHRIPIEFCPDGKGKSIFERYECHRLSSTRELVRRRRILNSKRDVVLYGAVDYNADLSSEASTGKDEAVQSVKPVEETGNTDGMLHSQMKVRGFRGTVDEVEIDAFPPLYGTREETERIKSCLDKQGFEVKAEVGRQATERSVKNLSGNSPLWIHFATHGFYLVSGESDAETDSIAESETDEDETSESSMLSRSALVMAGANCYVRNPQTAGSNGDGFLTAYEMSSLDFSMTDMVVMSACESGLGDIGAEGVFGLQRGVKKSGAHSILMALDKVNDHTAMLFMCAFYQSLAAGKTKMQALRDAQQCVRTSEGGCWNAPKFWASFILLDDI